MNFSEVKLNENNLTSDSHTNAVYQDVFAYCKMPSETVTRSPTRRRKEFQELAIWEVFTKGKAT